MSVPSNVPSIIRAQLSASNAAGFLDAINLAITTQGTHWDVLRYIPGSGMVLGQKDATANQRIWILQVTATQLSVRLDPNGRQADPTLSIINSLVNFSTITSAVSSAISPLISFTLTNLAAANELTDFVATRIDIVETDDCLTIFSNATGTTLFPAQQEMIYNGVQAGKIFTPDNPNEANLGIDGSGVITGWPGADFEDNYGFAWLHPEPRARGGSFVRTGQQSWERFHSPNCYVSNPSVNATTALTDGKYRPAQLTVAIASGPIVGRLKYVRLARTGTPVTYFGVDPAIITGSHQAWLLRLNSAGVGAGLTLASNVLHLWTQSPIKYA